LEHADKFGNPIFWEARLLPDRLVECLRFGKGVMGYILTFLIGGCKTENVFFNAEMVLSQR